MVDVAPLLALPITDRPEAEAFLRELYRLGLAHHFDDGAVDCLAGNGHVSEADAMRIDSLVDACYRAWEASGADLAHDCPIGFMLELMDVGDSEAAAEPTPDSVRAWLRENYSPQTIAGQPGHADPRATALVAWCNATENLARGGQSRADREQSERYVREGLPYLP